MKKISSFFLRSVVLLLWGLTLHIHAVSTDRSPVRLSGHIPLKHISKSMHMHNLHHDLHVPLTFVLPLRNREELDLLVQQMYDPLNTKHYGKYLSSEEFIERFAPTQEDYQMVRAYAESIGLTVTGTHANRTLLNVVSHSGAVETAFNLHMHLYQKPNGQTFYAPDNDPEIPDFIASTLHSVVGLDNHAIRHTYNRCKETTESVLTAHVAPQASPSGPKGGYSPNDLRTAYNLNGVSNTGVNQSVALFELASYRKSDIDAYTSYFGLPMANLTNILVDGGAGNGDGADEVTLDIELVLALAPSSKIYVYEGPNTGRGVLDTYNRIATDNIAKQVSTSWGLSEEDSSLQFLQAENTIFTQMAAQGQTIYAAAGDNGAYDNGSTLSVDDPASQPYVVGIGGTRLSVNSSSGAYSSESIWNNGLGFGAGGGGVSVIWGIPTWQQNILTTHSKTHRNVPDASLNSDPNTGYSIYYNGRWQIYGGTSCAAPLWAAFTALVNQTRMENSLPALGFANPLLYEIGMGPSYLTNFHDITSGTNLYYSAGVGYDNASGWGSFNGANLFASLSNSIAPPTPPSAPDLNMRMTHNGSFKKGRTGTYTIQVQNIGESPTTGTVKVAIALPRSLAYKSFQGTGWTFNRKTLTFSRNNVLNATTSFPSITLTVSVASNAPKTVTPSATVSGGGSVSNKVTNPTTTY